MEQLLEFSQGPLFAGCLAIMLLGLLRITVITVWGTVGAYKRDNDKNIPFKMLIKETLSWLFPVKQISNSRTLFSLISFTFHIGLLLVPLFSFPNLF